MRVTGDERAFAPADGPDVKGDDVVLIAHASKTQGSEVLLTNPAAPSEPANPDEFEPDFYDDEPQQPKSLMSSMGFGVDESRMNMLLSNPDVFDPATAADLSKLYISAAPNKSVVKK